MAVSSATSDMGSEGCDIPPSFVQPASQTGHMMKMDNATTVDRVLLNMMHFR